MAKDKQEYADSVDAQKLRAELDRIHKKKQGSGESSSALAQQRKMAAEGLGCHKVALAMVERIDGMSDEQLGDFKRSFDVLYAACAPDWELRTKDLVDRAEDSARDMETEIS